MHFLKNGKTLFYFRQNNIEYQEIMNRMLFKKDIGPINAFAL